MSHSSPFISVIVPAYNRPEGLRALLSALEEQSYPPYRFEVLICDDGSTPPLSERVSVKDCSFSVRFLRGENEGPATARNRGIKEARGSLIAFTDDDCVPEPLWLEAIAEALASQEAYAVHGPTTSQVPPIPPFVHALDIRQEHGVATANFAVKKEHLLGVGGFDETFTVPYFEDEDLSRRLQAAFGPIAWSEDMRVEHPHRRAKLSGMWRQAGYYYFLPYMQRRYPGYWAGAMPAVRKRALAKGLLVLLGVAAVAAPAFVVAWLALAAWQATRLKKLLAQAISVGTAIPVTDQLYFLAFEWTLDFTRWWAYARGRGLKPKPEPAEELVLE